MAEKSLTSGTPWKSILLFSLPIMAGNILQQLYNTADTIVVGNVEGETALSAVGTCMFLTNFYLAIALGLSFGAGIITAQLFGAGKSEELHRRAGTAVMLLVIIGFAASVIGICTSGFLIKYVLSVSGEILHMADIYFKIYSVGLIFQFGYNIAASLLRSVGDSKATLYLLLISSLVNIILDIVFVAVFHWSVAGAAWATVLSQACACIISFVYMYHNYEVLNFKLRELSLDKQTVRMILRTGMPMAIQQIIVSCGFMCIQRLVNSFGEAMIASYTVARRLECYLLIPATAIQISMSTFAGQNFGAKNVERIKCGLRQSLILSVLITGGLSVLAFLFLRILIGVFGLTGQSLEYCTSHMRVVVLAFIIFASYYPCTGMYQGIGKASFATVISASVLGMRIIFAYGLGSIPIIGYRSIWWCEPIAWLIAMGVNYIYYFCKIREKISIKNIHTL